MMDKLNMFLFEVAVKSVVHIFFREYKNSVFLLGSRSEDPTMFNDIGNGSLFRKLMYIDYNMLILEDEKYNLPNHGNVRSLSDLVFVRWGLD